MRVDDGSFSGKTDPTQYSHDSHEILVKSTYDTEKDPEGWMAHEYKHSEADRFGVKSNGEPYPCDNIESRAYREQFRLLWFRGFSFEDLKDRNRFPTLSLKIGKYEKILKKYWRNVNGV